MKTRPCNAFVPKPRGGTADVPRSARRYRFLMFPVLVLVVVPIGVGYLLLRPQPPFTPSFAGPDRLVTNERAFHHPAMPGVVPSSDWLVTSGSLFARDGLGWTGRPDHELPDTKSTNGTGSAVFRAVSTRDDFQDTTVSVRLRVEALTTTDGRNVYDGAHLFLRYQSPDELYGVTVFRQDGLIAIKRKSPGGDYQTLAAATRVQPMNTWLDVLVKAITLDSGSVRITLHLNGEQVLAATDRGQRAAAITEPGRVGLRGDNCQFSFSDFRAEALR